MAYRMEHLYRSTDYPYVNLRVTIHDSDMEPFELSCMADTGAEDYDLVVFDRDFDEERVHQSPVRQYLSLAGSAHSLSGNQYRCSVRFGRSGPYELTMIVVKKSIRRREALVGRGFLDRFISQLDGPRQTLEIFGG